MHLRDGEIRAYLDGELDPANRERVQSHLVDCLTCQDQQRRLADSKHQVSSWFNDLNMGISGAPLPVSAARTHLSAIIEAKEKEKMAKPWFVRYRPVLIVVAIVLIFAAAMAFPQARAIANSFLGLFRVERVQVVEVDPGNLPEQLVTSYQMEYLMSNDLQFEQMGEMQTMESVDEASRLAGYPIRLPEVNPGGMQLVVSPPARITFTVEVAQIQSILQEIGRGDIVLPAEIDGAVVTVNIPYLVTASYGDCTFEAENYPEGFDPDDPYTPPLECTTLAQMPSPQVEAPEGLDLRQLGEAYLQLLGMDQAEAARFSQNIDWASTLVLPIPVYGVSYREVPVDGVTGTLVLSDSADDQQQYVLMWIKDGIMYVLTGPGNASTAMEIAETLR